MKKPLLQRGQASKAPAIKGKGTQKLLFNILCILVAIYAIVAGVLNFPYLIALYTLLLVTFGFMGAKSLMGRSLFKWEYTLIMALSASAILFNSVWTIPNMLDLVWYEGWRATILIEPLIANFVFLALIILGYDLAFRNSPFKSWTA